MINTAYIERLNATFRQRLAWLTRRTRNLAQQTETLLAGMFVLGCFYNFCDQPPQPAAQTLHRLNEAIAGFSAPQPWLQD